MIKKCLLVKFIFSVVLVLVWVLVPKYSSKKPINANWQQLETDFTEGAHGSCLLCSQVDFNHWPHDLIVKIYEYEKMELFCNFFHQNMFSGCKICSSKNNYSFRGFSHDPPPLTPPLPWKQCTWPDISMISCSLGHLHSLGYQTVSFFAFSGPLYVILALQ